MNYFVDVSASMSDDLLIQVSTKILKQREVGDRVFAIGQFVEMLRFEDLPGSLLNSRCRGADFRPQSIYDFLSDLSDTTLFTDGDLRNSERELFANIILLPLCPVCQTSVGRDGFLDHTREMEDAHHALYEVMVA